MVVLHCTEEPLTTMGACRPVTLIAVTYGQEGGWMVAETLGEPCGGKGGKDTGCRRGGSFQETMEDGVGEMAEISESEIVRRIGI